MQGLAVLPSTAAGRTPLQPVERLETSLRQGGCSDRVFFVRRCSIQSFSSSSLYASSSSSKYGCPLRPRWGNATTRVLCMRDERESKSELNDVGDIVLDETGGKDSISQKVGSNYFSALEKEENKQRISAPAIKFDARHPFDLGWIAAWVDGVSERGMQRRRTFYSHNDWLQHRSSTRHYRHFASSLSSRAILSLIPPVGTVTSISVALALYNTIVLTGWLPSFIPLLHASPLSYQLTAPALALLLVFRTEASYSRYDEARKTWTKVISSSKDIARQSMAWAQGPVDYQQKELLLDYILAFPVALKVISQSMRNSCYHS